MSESETRDQRTVFRVGIAAAGLIARIGDDCTGVLLDANSEGFALKTKVPLGIGRVETITLTHDGQLFLGRARIRNVVPLRPGTYRCGFQTLPGETELRRGLRLVAIAAQRRQLRRLASRRAVNR